MAEKSKATAPPRCKICGADHWLKDGHVFKGKLGKAPALASAKKAVPLVPAGNVKKGRRP